jgi:predicted MPP superfamily phosphohydrolase
MIVFLLAILLSYGFLHLYIYYKIKAAIALGTASIILLICFMAIMVLAPVFVRLSERYGFESLARYLSYVGYTWMGIAFLFFLCSLLVDAYRLAVYTGGLLFKANPLVLLPSAKAALAVPAFMAAAILLYGLFEAVSIRTERAVIQSPKIPEHIDTITIAQISDVHLGLIVRHGRLKGILREVERAKPDIVVSTGDLVDGQIDNLTGLGELLKNVDAPYGKFAVTGNHEFYAGLDQALRFTEKAGFTILRHEALAAAGSLTMVGIDDPTGKRFGLSGALSEQSLLSKVSPERFTILLKHQPVVDRNSAGLFDLQLSGHTHGGQIFPINLLVWLFYPVHSGLTRLENGSYLYVSRGSGTWGPPIRFLSPPEVTIIELVHGRT